MSLFKKKNKKTDIPADMPPMPELPNIDNTNAQATPQPAANAQELPNLPDLEIPSPPNQAPAANTQQTPPSLDIPTEQASQTGTDPQNDFLTQEENNPLPAVPELPDEQPAEQELDNFNITDEELAGLNFDEPVETAQPNPSTQEPAPAVQTQPPTTPAEPEAPVQKEEKTEPAPSIPEPPMFDDNEGPLFITTKNFRNVIGMLDDSSKQLENELTVGSEVLNNNGLQLKSLEHLHTEFMQMYKKLNTVDEILFERNS